MAPVVSNDQDSLKSLCIISQYYKPEIGAPQNRLYELATGLSQRGWRVEIITSLPNYPKGRIFKEYRRKFSVSEWLDGIYIKRYWIFASNSKKVFPRILSMISFSLIVFSSLFYLKRKKFRFILVESPPLTLGFSGLFLSKIVKAKFIFNVSDLWPLSALELGVISKGIVYKNLLHLEQYLYSRADICMGQSQQIVDYIKKRGSKETYLFRNGVDPRRFEGVPFTHRSEDFRIVYAGLLGVAQGIFDLCSNVDFKLLNIEFHIYGDGIEKDLIRKYIENNMDCRISYMGSISRNEIPYTLRKYNATLISLTSMIYGAVPSKIYESMAAGLPIIFSGDGEAKSIIEKYRVGLVSPPKDFSALKGNIELLFTNNALAKEMRNNCLRAANSDFNRPVQIGNLEVFLETHASNFATNAKKDI